MKKILVTGAVGQIGSELTMSLRERYGNSNIVAGGRKTKPSAKLLNSGPFEIVDCIDAQAIANVVKGHNIDTIYHLAAILSAVAEANPVLAWNVNINGLYNVLEVAREYKCAVFTPSSIGAFGPGTPLDNTPQDTIQRPNTMYGVTKVSGELLCDYYYKRFNVDTRGVRYPGIISNETLPGGGTTDYAVEIYYEAIKHKKYTCNLPAGTFLDMMYMPDAIKAGIDLMEADPARLIHRNAFNVTAMSFDPEIIAAAIRKHIPEFQLNYNVDPIKKAIAETWPNSMDDSAARNEWGWKPEYNLEAMTIDMLEVLSNKL
ncbi:MAG: L-threonine 3-dehydrogenase [Candidatus Neomarinimicrobiota bacterium]